MTIMVDQSMPTNEGGKSRLANVAAALNARLQALPPNSAEGPPPRTLKDCPLLEEKSKEAGSPG